jgi:hypothetical protein
MTQPNNIPVRPTITTTKFCYTFTHFHWLLLQVPVGHNTSPATTPTCKMMNTSSLKNCTTDHFLVYSQWRCWVEGQSESVVQLRQQRTDRGHKNISCPCHLAHRIGPFSSSIRFFLGYNKQMMKKVMDCGKLLSWQCYRHLYLQCWYHNFKNMSKLTECTQACTVHTSVYHTSSTQSDVYVATACYLWNWDASAPSNGDMYAIQYKDSSNTSISNVMIHMMLT